VIGEMQPLAAYVCHRLLLYDQLQRAPLIGQNASRDVHRNEMTASGC